MCGEMLGVLEAEAFLRAAADALAAFGGLEGPGVWVTVCGDSWRVSIGRQADTCGCDGDGW